ncbi:Phorbol ester/diacylglycerol-binding protein [Schistosoma japonicum]|uniref:Phorbol ester/diacylglycerol-binding protein n=1 Tax=Schistosoma japonicum TaxID=6182 RepID=A0A4Z2CS54_SCHJA|nr:Phorbol ester/diacylglycerol-binding protein [Schistosoma japonicum]
MPLLCIKIIEARLESTESSLNTYITVKLRQAQSSTQAVRGIKPKWNEEFTFETERMDGGLLIELHSKGLLRDKILGVVWLPLNKILHSDKDGPGMWMNFDAEIITENGQVVGTKIPTKHSCLATIHQLKRFFMGKENYQILLARNGDIHRSSTRQHFMNGFPGHNMANFHPDQQRERREKLFVPFGPVSDSESRLSSNINQYEDYMQRHCRQYRSTNYLDPNHYGYSVDYSDVLNDLSLNERKFTTNDSEVQSSETLKNYPYFMSSRHNDQQDEQGPFDSEFDSGSEPLYYNSRPYPSSRRSRQYSHRQYTGDYEWDDEQICYYHHNLNKVDSGIQQQYSEENFTSEPEYSDQNYQQPYSHRSESNGYHIDWLDDTPTSECSQPEEECMFNSNYDNFPHQQPYTRNIRSYCQSGRSDDEEYLYPPPPINEQNQFYSDCGPFSDIDEPEWNPDYVSYRYDGDLLPWTDDYQTRFGQRRRRYRFSPQASRYYRRAYSRLPHPQSAYGISSSDVCCDKYPHTKYGTSSNYYCCSCESDYEVDTKIICCDQTQHYTPIGMNYQLEASSPSISKPSLALSRSSSPTRAYSSNVYLKVISPESVKNDFRASAEAAVAQHLPPGEHPADLHFVNVTPIPVTSSVASLDILTVSTSAGVWDHSKRDNTMNQPRDTSVSTVSTTSTIISTLPSRSRLATAQYSISQSNDNSQLIPNSYATAEKSSLNKLNAVSPQETSTSTLAYNADLSHGLTTQKQELIPKVIPVSITCYSPTVTTTTSTTISGTTTNFQSLWDQKSAFKPVIRSLEAAKDRFFSSNTLFPTFSQVKQTVVVGQSDEKSKITVDSFDKKSEIASSSLGFISNNYNTNNVSKIAISSSEFSALVPPPPKPSKFSSSVLDLSSTNCFNYEFPPVQKLNNTFLPIKDFSDKLPSSTVISTSTLNATTLFTAAISTPTKTTGINVDDYKPYKASLTSNYLSSQLHGINYSLTAKPTTSEAHFSADNDQNLDDHSHNLQGSTCYHDISKPPSPKIVKESLDYVTPKYENQHTFSAEEHLKQLRMRAGLGPIPGYESVTLRSASSMTPLKTDDTTHSSAYQSSSVSSAMSPYFNHETSHPKSTYSVNINSFIPKIQSSSTSTPSIPSLLSNIKSGFTGPLSRMQPQATSYSGHQSATANKPSTSGLFSNFLTTAASKAQTVATGALKQANAAADAAKVAANQAAEQFVAQANQVHQRTTNQMQQQPHLKTSIQLSSIQSKVTAMNNIQESVKSDYTMK